MATFNLGNVASPINQALRLAQLQEAQNPNLALQRQVQQAVELQRIQQESPEGQLALQLKQAQLASALQNQAIQQQQLQNLQNPDAAIAREFQRQLGLATLNPNSGYSVVPQEFNGQTIGVPNVIPTGENEAALTQALSNNPNIVIPSAPSTASLVPVINPVTGKATNVGFNANVPLAAEARKNSDKLALANAHLKRNGLPGKYEIDTNGDLFYLASPTVPGTSPTVTKVETPEGGAFKPLPKPTKGSSGTGTLTENQKLLSERKASDAGIDPENEKYINEDGTRNFSKLVIDTGKASRENKRLADAVKAAELTGKAKTDIEALNAAEKQLHSLQDEITDIAKSGKTPTFYDNLIAAETAAPPTGFFSAGWQQLLKGVQSDESKILEDKKSIISSSLVKAISGLAVSKQEAARLGFVPRAGDSFEELVRKAAGVQEYINNQRSGLQIPPNSPVSSSVATPGINGNAPNPIKIGRFTVTPH